MSVTDVERVDNVCPQVFFRLRGYMKRDIWFGERMTADLSVLDDGNIRQDPECAGPVGHPLVSVPPNHKHLSLRRNMDVHSVPLEHDRNNTSRQWTVLA